MDAAAEPEFRIGVGPRNARFGLPQACQHFLRVVADGRDDAHPGDDDPPHVLTFPAPRLRSGCRLQRRDVAEQADLEIERAVDNRSIRRQPAVGYPQHQLRAHDPLDVDAIDHFLDRGLNLAGKLYFAEPERAALALTAGPAEEETDQLPQGVEAEAARHHRITLEMTRKKPQVRLHIELGAGEALAVPAALFGNL